MTQFKCPIDSPSAVDPSKIGSYPALTKAGGGYFYDEVLEYRVWVHPQKGDDYFKAFPTCEKALIFSQKTDRAEDPLVLVRQNEWIDEPTLGEFIPKTGNRLTEWLVPWLAGNKRQRDTIPNFLARKK